MKKRKPRLIREEGKVRLELVPHSALTEEAKALDHGNAKEGRTAYNWRRDRVRLRDQIGGALRHINRFLDGQDVDPKSLAHELGHARARLGIVIDAQKSGLLVDDRLPLKPRTSRARQS